MARNKFTESEAIEIVKSLLPNHVSFIGWVGGNWKGAHTKLILKCDKHGIWETTEFNSLKRKIVKDCPKCSKDKPRRKKLTPEEAYKLVLDIHKDDDIIYDYSNIKLQNSITKETTIEVICPIHDKFTVKFSTLLIGKNSGKCPKCRSLELINRNSLSREEAIKNIKDKILKIKNEFGTDLEFLGFREEKEGKLIKNNISDCHLVLKCKIHNIIWNTTDYINFIHSSGVFCPSCSRKSTMSGLEKKCECSINKILSNPKIQTQFHIDNILDTVTNSLRSMRADFYLPDYNTIVEVDGEQHYKYIPMYHEKGYSHYNDRVNRDNCLVRYCKENSINLLRIPWCDISRIDDIIKAFFVDGKDITTKVDPILLPIKYEGGTVNG